MAFKSRLKCLFLKPIFCILFATFLHFARNTTLAYFGQAYTDWRNAEDPKDYEKVYAFGIDFNYLLENYNRPDYAIIDTLCKRIEELISK